MPYSAEISRRNPSCILFLIDQSGSMSDPFGNGESTKPKAAGAADAVNKLLQNLVVKCARDEGVRDFFHVGVLGYGAHVRPAFGGTLSGRELVALSEIADSPLRIEERKKRSDDGAGGINEQSVRFPIWFEPTADNGTPMTSALSHGQTIVSQWLGEHPDCFPPIVINITDGQSTDGDPSAPGNSITQLSSTDGNVLLFNIHLSQSASAPIEFPDSESGLPDQFAQQLFRMSSILPDSTRSAASQEGYNVNERSRGFAFNADIVALIKFLDIGTRASNLK